MSMRHLRGGGNMIGRYVSLQSRSLALELELKGFEHSSTTSSVDKPSEELVKIETAYLTLNYIFARELQKDLCYILRRYIITPKII